MASLSVALVTRLVERLGVGVEEFGLDGGAVDALDEGRDGLPGRLDVVSQPRPGEDFAEPCAPLHWRADSLED